MGKTIFETDLQAKKDATLFDAETLLEQTKHFAGVDVVKIEDKTRQATTNIKAAAVTTTVLTANGKKKILPPLQDAANAEQYLKWAANGDFWDLSLLYELTPPEPLRNRGTEYINTHIGDVREMLETRGVSPETVAVVLTDYRRVIMGDFTITANLAQINEALKCVMPIMAFVVDKYVLFEILFTIYARYRIAAAKYVNWVDNPETATTETKKRFLDGSDFSAIEARAFVWLVAEIMNPAKLMDVAEPWQISAYIDDCTARGNLAEYAYYYIIAKYCLSATPEELDAIPEPPARWKEGYTTRGFAEVMAEKAEQAVKEFADKITEVATTEAEPNTEAERLAEQAAKIAVKVWNGTKQIQVETAPTSTDRVRIPETFGLLLSRDVYAAVNGNTNNILPIQAFINDYMQRQNLTGLISPRTVEKTIEGLNLLQRIRKVTPSNGIYTFETNISEFSGLCGFTDANEEQKREILTALGVLNGLYLVVWRAKGPTAVNVLNIREIGLGGQAKGDLLLDVTAAAMKGRPQLVTWDDFEALRKRAKGMAQNHFRYQILSKGHKTETALLNEVFGYDNAIAEAQQFGTPEDVATVKRNIKAHKPRDKKKLAQWFEDYQNGGYIRYTCKPNARGENVYKWETLKTVQVEPLEPEETATEPDEQ